MKKTCTKCKQNKLLTEYYPTTKKKRSDGRAILYARCKSCCKQEDLERKRKKRAAEAPSTYPYRAASRTDGKKICKECRKLKAISAFPVHGNKVRKDGSDIPHSRCLPCHRLDNNRRQLKRRIAIEQGTWIPTKKEVAPISVDAPIPEIILPSIWEIQEPFLEEQDVLYKAFETLYRQFLKCSYPPQEASILAMKQLDTIPTKNILN